MQLKYDPKKKKNSILSAEFVFRFSTFLKLKEEFITEEEAPF